MSTVKSHVTGREMQLPAQGKDAESPSAVVRPSGLPSRLLAYLSPRAIMLAVVAVVTLMLVGPVMLPPAVHDLHYMYLADNLLQGKLSVDNIPTRYADLVFWHGHIYLPFGPLPALLLIPFLPILNAGVSLVWVGYAVTLVNIWLFYRVLGKAGIADDRRPWSLLLFFGGTVYLTVGVIGSSYFLAHMVSIALMLLAVWASLGDKPRSLLAGLAIGLAGMTRLTTIFCLPFFLWLLWKGWDAPSRILDGEERAEPAAPRGTLKSLAARFAPLFLGIAGPMLLLLAYNYLRFGSPFESGYAVATLAIPLLEQARSHGLFSLVHVPKNLFMLFLQGPTAYPSDYAPVLQFPYVAPSPWGMGLVYTSPALLFALRASLKNRFIQACWLGVLFGMMPVITYYGIGWIQFGYRYALDFLPFVLLLAARGFPTPMTRLAKILVLASVAVCLWGSVFMLIWIHMLPPS